MNHNLLSIAIPTWNREVQLSEALKHLLPQIEKYSSKIELIISDNASTDNTINIVNDLLDNYPLINFTLFEQKENTGFFGNFHKCISLGNGKYFWLLSDDDFVFDGVIDELMVILSKEDVGAIFLNDWTNDKSGKENFICKYVNKLHFFNDRPYRHSLISGIIYRHNVNGNDPVFELLKGNALIGYAVYLKATHNFNKFAILKGNSLIVHNDHEIRFNALWIFTVDLAKCLKFTKDFYPEAIKIKIANSFLKTNILLHYKKYKFYNEYNFEKNKSLLIFRDFIEFKEFWLKIFPLIVCPKFLFKILKSLRNIKKLKHWN